MINAPNYFKPPVLLFAFLLTALVCAADEIDAARVRQIVATLTAAPGSFGQPITNRPAWSKAALELKAVIAAAEKMAAQPDPEMTDDLYLDCSRTGNRDRGQKVDYERSARLTMFALAECAENRGRFLAPLQKTIEALCSERAWTYPAHDLSLVVFEGRAMNPDLRATLLAFNLATADYLLGDKLPAATRRLIRDNVRRRVLLPFRETVEGRRKEISWQRISNNWNAVCLAGTIGAALALEESPEDRAWYIATAEHYIQNFLHGFGADGYCFEGIGYWNYGFGHFVILTEEIRLATQGSVDLFALPEANLPARFGSRDEIISQIYPSISDVSPGTKPDLTILRYIDARLDNPADSRFKSRIGIDTRNLGDAAFDLFDQNPPPLVKIVQPAKDSPLRTWFSDGGVLIARPTPGDARQFAAVLKGGSNGETHNHNDVGSFSVVSGKTMLICDPGAEVYTRRTFSAKRYDSGVLNSFGHAVPIVAGKLQATGSAARAVVLRTNFTDAEDSLVFDLRSAYSVPDLKKLERSFTYRRGKDVGLLVRDDVGFEQPEQFESALITWGEWKELSTNEFEITDDSASVRVTIDTGGVPFTIRKSLIDEDIHTPQKPWHIGVVLSEPVKRATVSFIIRPLVEKH